MEFLKKNKFAAIALLVLVLLGSFIALKEPAKPAKPACVQAPQDELEIIGFFCAQQLKGPDLKTEACLALKGSTDCVFNEEEDGAALNAWFINKLKPCIDASLVPAGFCPFEGK